MGNAADEEFNAYLAAAISGDRVAVDYILRVIRPLVVRYCRARLGRTERTFASADDVAQEVCMAVLTSLPSYRNQGRPFLAFVYGIAAHKVIDAHRAAGRNKPDPVLDDPGDVFVHERAEYVASLSRILDVEAGLTHALGVASLRTTTAQLAQKLDIEAGLAAALGHIKSSREARGNGSTPATQLEEQLIAAARGDTRAQVAVEATIRPVIMDYCRGKLQDVERKRSIIREACASVLASLTTYKDREEFFSYVLDVAADKVTGARLAEIDAATVVSSEVSDGPEQRALRFETSGELQSLLELLPEKQREMLILRVVNGLSPEEVAEAVGATPGAVRVAQHRALGRLRKAMTEGK
jgi:RNA polymerase sigma-70 factor (ECF subfamily)